MPLTIYCNNNNCSEPILYSLTKPIMCPFCGSKLEQNISVSSKNTTIPKTRVIETVVEEDNNYTPENFNVKVRVIGDDGEKFESIARQQKTGYKEAKSKRVNKKAAFEEFRKEAGFGNLQPIEINDSQPE